MPRTDRYERAKLRVALTHVLRKCAIEIIESSQKIPSNHSQTNSKYGLEHLDAVVELRACVHDFDALNL